MTAATGAGGSRGRTAVVVAVLVGALLLVGGLTADRRSSVRFDPESTSKDGTRAMVELVESFGAEVSVPERFPVGNEADVAIAMQDVIPSDRNDAVMRWVSEGHTLVMADPRAEVTPPADRMDELPDTTKVAQGSCSIEALRTVREIEVGERTAASLRYIDDGTRPVCFAADGEAFAIVVPHGRGQVVGLAAATPFLNQHLGRSDNAVLATSLLAPRPGTKVAFLGPKAFPGGGGGELGSISGSVDRLLALNPSLPLFLLECLVAVGLYALARGRRLGRPLHEPQPVQIAGSELVGAVGHLLQQRRDPSRAATVLRADLRRVLGDRLGLARGAPPGVLAEALVARTGCSRDEAGYLVEDRPVADNAALVALANRIEAIREEILHGHAH